jgi:pimeloyl-ACP methyl ester carboxylesterase
MTIQGETTIRLPGGVTLYADVGAAQGAAIGTIVFVHGSGSSRHSPRNRLVADVLRKAGMQTLLLDLLTSAEEAVDVRTREYRFDIPLLAERVIGVIDWMNDLHEFDDAGVGLFGASTGAAAALIAAAQRPNNVGAVVSRGGRPDLAHGALPHVMAPTLLIVGGNDPIVEQLNREAQAAMTATTSLVIVPGATHLFEEPGTLDIVADLAAEWFRNHLAR